MRLKSVLYVILFLTTTPRLVAMELSGVTLQEYKAVLNTGTCAEIVNMTQRLGGYSGSSSLHIKLADDTHELCVGGSINNMSENAQQEYKNVLLAFMLDTILRSIINAKKAPTDTELVAAFKAIQVLEGRRVVKRNTAQFSGILHDGNTYRVRGPIENKVANCLRLALYQAWPVQINDCTARYSVPTTANTYSIEVNAIVAQVRRVKAVDADPSDLGEILVSDVVPDSDELDSILYKPVLPGTREKLVYEEKDFDQKDELHKAVAVANERTGIGLSHEQNRVIPPVGDGHDFYLHQEGTPVLVTSKQAPFARLWFAAPFSILALYAVYSTCKKVHTEQPATQDDLVEHDDASGVQHDAGTPCVEGTSAS